MGLLLITSHLAACVWFYTSRFQDFDTDTWVYREHMVNASYATKYITAYFWAIETLCTIGYGDLPAITVLEQSFAIIWLIFGVGFYSFTIGDLTTLIMEMNHRTAFLAKLNNSFNDIAVLCNIPEPLKRKVQRFYEINSRLNMFWGLEIDTFLMEIPRIIREEIILYSYQSIID